MIRKQSDRGTGHSVVQLQDTQHVYVAALPRTGADLAGQLRDALGTVRAIMDEYGSHGPVVQQAVFVPDVRRIDTCRRLVEEFHGEEMPVTTYVPQAPCEDKLVAVEAFGVGRQEQPVEIERHSKQLVITRHDGVTWCHCGDIETGDLNGALHAGALDAFGRVAGMLNNAGFSFSQVVRTWLYLGNIVGPEGNRQRYQELNRARGDFYSRVHFAHTAVRPAGANSRFYPASTGIGAEGSSVAMSCIALRSERDDLSVVALENPNQTSAFEYDACYGPKSPCFSRAVAVVNDRVVTVFISGTASITGARSRHVGDVERQTHQTLDNIEALISPANFRFHGIPRAGATLADLAHTRVYVKRAADYEKVRGICHDRLGSLPTIYAVADVCRPELLVEIEGVAFSARNGR